MKRRGRDNMLEDIGEQFEIMTRNSQKKFEVIDL